MNAQWEPAGGVRLALLARHLGARGRRAERAHLPARTGAREAGAEQDRGRQMLTKPPNRIRKRRAADLVGAA